jgi:hypothetical protein
MSDLLIRTILTLFHEGNSSQDSGTHPHQYGTEQVTVQQPQQTQQIQQQPLLLQQQEIQQERPILLPQLELPPNQQLPLPQHHFSECQQQSPQAHIQQPSHAETTIQGNEQIRIEAGIFPNLRNQPELQQQLPTVQQMPQSQFLQSQQLERSIAGQQTVSDHAAVIAQLQELCDQLHRQLMQHQQNQQMEASIF